MTAFDVRTRPLVVGRAPAFPLDLALSVFADADPLEATRRVFETNAGVRLALETASPSLAAAVEQWVAGEPLRNPKTPVRALAYLLRMSSRPTPFGLCSGIGEVEIGERSTLRIDEASSERRTHTRFDMGYLGLLAREFERSEARSRIAYVTNDCAVERGGRLYVTDVKLSNVKKGASTRADQRPISLKNTEAVAFVREMCAEPMVFTEIVARLAARFEAPVEQASRLVEQLIGSAVLIGELQPSPIGDPAAYLLGRFRELGAPWCETLDAALVEMESLDRLPLAQRTQERYRALDASLRSVCADAPPDAVQIDTRVSFEGQLSASVLKDVERFVDISVRMSPTIALERLHQAFMDRYEGTERLVPLLELADVNVGIPIPHMAAPIESDTAKRDSLIMELASRGLRDLREEIELTEAELAIVAPPLGDDDRCWPSIEVGFGIDAANVSALDSGDYRIVPTGFTLTDGATRSLGRLAHLFDESFQARAREIAAVTSSPDEVNVEFAFALSADRGYNVVTRPLWHDYVLSVGIGERSAGEMVRLDDLWVGIDNERFFLWSERLQKRVSIRETHVFGTAYLAPDLCRLLSLLRYDRVRPAVEFEWGFAWNATYLPRIRSGRIVLSPRTWSFDRETFDLTRDRKAWGMPRFVYFVNEDQRLLLDLDSAAASALIEDQGATFRRMRFVEALPAPDRTWLHGASGAYAVEFVAQACSTRSHVQPSRNPSPVAVRRVHGPGSDWTYGKLYIGAQAMDQLIVTHLRPFADELRAEASIDRWFFVRYADPHPNVRVRLRATPGNEATVRERFLALTQRLLDQGFIWRAATDTYSPEYERYGGPDEIDLAERFFTLDSDRVSSTLAQGVGGTDALVATAAAGCEAILATPEERALIIETFASLARKKFSPKDRESLRALLQRDVPTSDGNDTGEGARAPKRILDLMHMHCNRLGVDTSDEPRVYALVRALALGRRERQNGSRLLDSRTADC